MWQGRNRKPFFTPTTKPPTGEYICRRLFIPASKEALELVNGVLSLLTNIENFAETPDGMTPERTAVMFNEMWLDYLGVFQTMIGAVIPMLVETLPGSMLWCDGSEYLRENFPELYDALPASFRLDEDRFIVPDLRNVFVMGAGDTYDVGDTGGAAEITLTEAQMPVHTHTTQPHRHYHQPLVTGDFDVEGAGIPQPNAAQIVPLTQNLTDFETVTVDPAGGDGDPLETQPHANLPPYFALKFAIVAKWKECR